MKACAQCKLRYPNDGDLCFVCGRELTEALDPLLGVTLAGRYLLESVIGEGGMATVYAARHRLVDRRCAVKVMSDGFAKNEVIRERFRREAKATQKLAHPNIIEIFDQGETPEGSLYLVMELLDGETLAALIGRGAIAIERTLPIGLQIASALARAHDLGVIHRDLKPENVFLCAEGDSSINVKLLDFGIARSAQDTRLTGAGEVFGTPEYMAPERVSSIDAGPSADLYALGVILYEMLCGELPFDAPHPMSLLVKHLKERPPPLRQRKRSIPESAEKLVMELLEKDPKDRPVDAHRVQADLASIAQELRIEPPREAPPKAASRRTPAKTLPPVALDQWLRRTAVFDRMLEAAHPRGDSRLASLLGDVKRLVAEISELRARAVEQQRALEATETRGRETRQRFGHAVDALGVDASRARDELKAALAEETRLRAQAEAPAALKAALLDIQRWEGRSALQVPYTELARAYRHAADLVDEWRAAFQSVDSAAAVVTQRKSEVEDIEFQIEELSTALATHEEQLEREEEDRRRSVGELGRKAEELEKRLLDLASEFCASLRGQPALDPLFSELEEVTVQAAAS